MHIAQQRGREEAPGFTGQRAWGLMERGPFGNDGVDHAFKSGILVGIVNTMNGDLPPSSSVRDLPLPAIWLRMVRPTSVDPVTAILSTPAWPNSARQSRHRR